MADDNTSLSDGNCVYMIHLYKVKSVDMKKALEPFASKT